MTFWSVALACAVGSYLIGAIPFALLLGKVKGLDVRTIGSGNVGAMNLGRVLGRSWFFAVFALDALKGLAPSLLAGWILMSSVLPEGPSEPIRNLCRLLVGAMAVVGHNYPVYIGFRGGKGVSTSFGVAAGVWPELTVPAVLSFFTWVMGLALTRMSSVGSITGAILFPIYFVLATVWSGASLMNRWPFMVFAIAVAAMVLARHRANIARILAGTETKVVGESEQAPASPSR